MYCGSVVAITCSGNSPSWMFNEFLSSYLYSLLLFDTIPILGIEPRHFDLTLVHHLTTLEIKKKKKYEFSIMIKYRCIIRTKGCIVSYIWLPVAKENAIVLT
jgi:hypothetical protein